LIVTSTRDLLDDLRGSSHVEGKSEAVGNMMVEVVAAATQHIGCLFTDRDEYRLVVQTLTLMMDERHGMSPALTLRLFAAYTDFLVAVLPRLGRNHGSHRGPYALLEGYLIQFHRNLPRLANDDDRITTAQHAIELLNTALVTLPERVSGGSNGSGSGGGSHRLLQMFFASLSVSILNSRSPPSVLFLHSLLDLLQTALDAHSVGDPGATVALLGICHQMQASIESRLGDIQDAEGRFSLTNELQQLEFVQDEIMAGIDDGPLNRHMAEIMRRDSGGFLEPIHPIEGVSMRVSLASRGGRQGPPRRQFSSALRYVHPWRCSLLLC